MPVNHVNDCVARRDQLLCDLLKFCLHCLMQAKQSTFSCIPKHSISTPAPSLRISTYFHVYFRTPNDRKQQSDQARTYLNKMSYHVRLDVHTACTPK